MSGLISIIISSYKKQELSRDFLRSFREFAPEFAFEIIWIDDASGEEPVACVRQELDGLPHQLIVNECNHGFAYNNNHGAAIARGNALLFLNNDLVLKHGWFASLGGLLDNLDGLGMIGQVQLNPKTGLVDHAGVGFDLIGCPDHYLKGKDPASLHGRGRFSKAVTAACCMIRRDLFLSAGGFDEAFRNGCEDVDLCLRLGQMGYRHWVDYRSVIYHHVSSSPGRKDHELRNQALFLKRWGHLTSKWGQEDWPRNYLSRYARTPWRLNGVKTVDALMRLAGLKHGDSEWARRKREEIMAYAPPEADEFGRV